MILNDDLFKGMEIKKIVVEVYGGSDIDDISLNISILSNALKCPVSFEFNGLDVVVYPGDDGDEISKLYHEEVKRRSRPLMMDRNRCRDSI